jgi:hypothetical protein
MLTIAGKEYTVAQYREKVAHILTVNKPDYKCKKAFTWLAKSQNITSLAELVKLAGEFEVKTI